MVGNESESKRAPLTTDSSSPKVNPNEMRNGLKFIGRKQLGSFGHTSKVGSSSSVEKEGGMKTEWVHEECICSGGLLFDSTTTLVGQHSRAFSRLHEWNLQLCHQKWWMHCFFVVLSVLLCSALLVVSAPVYPLER